MYCFVCLFVVSSFMAPLGPLKGHPASLSALVLLVLHPVQFEAGQFTHGPLGQCSREASRKSF